jgi:predicted GNAT family acetyltransferase
MDQRRFEHDSVTRRYLVHVGDEQVGFADYDRIGATSVLIKHTEIDPAHEGKGHASALVRFMLDDLRSQAKSVIPICPYTSAFIRRHPEYLDVVREDYRPNLR